MIFFYQKLYIAVIEKLSFNLSHVLLIDFLECEGGGNWFKMEISMDKGLE